MDLLGLALSLSLGMDAQGFTGNYQFDMSPTFQVNAPIGAVLGRDVGATALPGMVVVNPEKYPNGLPPARQQEEMRHQDQWRALGPAFLPSYVASAGRPFEPYDRISGEFPEDWRSATDRMWSPPSDLANQFPLMRVSSQDGVQALQLLPGYPGAEFTVEK